MKPKPKQKNSGARPHVIYIDSLAKLPAGELVEFDNLTQLRDAQLSGGKLYHMVDQRKYWWEPGK